MKRQFIRAHEIAAVLVVQRSETVVVVAVRVRKNRAAVVVT